MIRTDFHGSLVIFSYGPISINLGRPLFYYNEFLPAQISFLFLNKQEAQL